MNTKDTTKKVFEFQADVHGNGNVNFSWSFDFSFLAVCGENRNVYIIDRRGKKLREIPLNNSGKVLALDWDKDNEFLCILQENLSFVSIWNIFNNNQLVEIDVGNTKEKVSFAKWSKTHPVLAIGTDKGSLVFYNKKNQKKIPTVGKHAKRIVSGDWNKEGYLLTGGEDKLLTVSNHTSETAFEQMSVKSEPQMLQWARQKTDDRESKQRTVVSVLNKKTILMFEIQGNQQPLELVFEQKYGNIIDYSLFGDGYIVVGFSKGWVAHISTHIKELKEEVSSEQIFLTTLDALTTNDSLYKLAAAGENCIKFYNLSTWKEIKNERIELPKNAGKVVKLQWIPSGQLLVVATTTGQLYGYLTAPPSLNSVYGSYVALLSSFTEVSLFDCTKVGVIPPQIGTISLELEPGYLSNGPFHVAAGMNNLGYYYRWYDNKGKQIINGGSLVMKKDYYSSIKQMAINSYWAAVLTEGKCFLHPIEEDANAAAKERKFPSTENEKPISYIGLTEKFLIMLDNTGRIKIFHLEDLILIQEYKPEGLLTKFSPNLYGTRLVCNDNSGNSSIFMTANDAMVAIQGYPPKTQRVLWDVNDSNQFITIDNEAIQVFVISRYSLHGASCTNVREALSIEDLSKDQPYVTYLDKGVKPLILNNGFLFFLTPTGAVQGQYLATHSYLPVWKGKSDSPEGHFRYFLQSLCLNKFSNCLVAAGYLDAAELYDILGRKCLEHLELDIAYRAYQSAKNLSMVLTIESFKHETETNVLLGNVAMIFGLYDIAQEFFLKSNKPLLALDMRCDVQDWVIGLNLAKTIAPEQEQFICRRLAAQVEAQGNSAESLRLYEKALLKPEHEGKFEKKKVDNHNTLCYAGIARCSIKLGDINRGVSIGSQLQDQQQQIEIAMVCENTKNLQEAAQLYERCGLAEKAASIYISLKEFKQATQLISKIQSPKLLIQLAKAKEAEGIFKEAEALYVKAEDWENAIRVNLKHLKNFDKAKELCRSKCPTQTCSQLIANHCLDTNNKVDAIEFLLMAGKNDEAFNIAVSTNNMDNYVKALKEVTPDEGLRIAQYWEGKGELGKAAKQYENSGQNLKALKLFIQSGEQYFESAIELVSRVKTDNLVQILIAFLTGESNNSPQDPRWLYKLFIALGNLDKAAKIAITISSEEQERGNYKAAHSILFETQRDLKEKNLSIPWDLYQRLLVLHSYVIVKRLVKMGEHDTAARMLNRVCKNISQFPAHDATILTSAVLQAMKANLKGMAYQWAITLMYPEYAPKIPEAHRDKISKIARKPVNEEVEEKSSPCPFCSQEVPETQMECSRCQNNISFCIASGKHIVLESCTFCPGCNNPAIADMLRKSLEVESTCPMCGIEIKLNDVREVRPEEALEKIKIKPQEEPKKEAAKP